MNEICRLQVTALPITAGETFSAKTLDGRRVVALVDRVSWWFPIVVGTIRWFLPRRWRWRPFQAALSRGFEIKVLYEETAKEQEAV